MLVKTRATNLYCDIHKQTPLPFCNFRNKFLRIRISNIISKAIGCSFYLFQTGKLIADCLEMLTYEFKCESRVFYTD